MPYSPRVITRRRLALLSVSTALATLNLSQPAEAQNLNPLVARLAARFLIWGAVLYLVDKALSDDGTSHKEVRDSAPAPPAVSPTNNAARTQTAEQTQPATDAAKLASAKRVADKLRVDVKWGQQIIDQHGVEVGQKIGDGNLTVWPQRDTSEQRVFDVTLTNPTNQSRTGAMHIVIRDVTTGDEEFNYMFRGYRVAAFSTLTYAVPFNASFARAGLKQISLHESDVLTTTPTDVLVMPFSTKGG